MSLGSVWKRYGCCPIDEENVISDSAVKVMLSGYFYRTIPEWYLADGSSAVPIRFTTNSQQMQMIWTFDSTVSGGSLLFSTSEEVRPNLFSLPSGEPLTLRKYSYHNGYTLWLVKM